MMDNTITWNVRNWVTVFLMFLAGWAVISLGVKFARGGLGNGAKKSAQDAGNGAAGNSGFGG